MPSRRSFLVQAGLLAAGFGVAWWLREEVLWSAPQPQFGAEGSTGWIDFAARGPLPTVRAEVEGRQANALIDSGAQYSVIDRGFAGSLGLEPGFAPLVAVGASGQPQVGRGVSVDVAVGRLRLAGLNAAMLELGPITGPKGLSTPLILGQDVLRQLIADIDFPGRRLRLHPPGTHALPDGARPVDARAKGRALAVAIRVGEAPLEVVVDTGASVVLALARDVADELGLMDDQTPRRAVTMVLGGAVAGPVVRAREITFAGETWEDADVMVFEQSRIPGFPRGLLGAGALGRFRAVLNLGAGALHLV